MRYKNISTNSLQMLSHKLSWDNTQYMNLSQVCQHTHFQGELVARLPSNIHGPDSAMEARWTSNPEVAGSSPVRVVNFFIHFCQHYILEESYFIISFCRFLKKVLQNILLAHSKLIQLVKCVIPPNSYIEQ